MAVHSSLKELFTGIADAIREKSGGTGEIVADNFPEEIKKLETHDGEDAIVTRTYGDFYVNDRVEKIGRYAFYAKDRLYSVSFANATVMEEHAFDSCSYLRSIDAPNLMGIETYGLGRTLIDKCNFPKLGYVDNYAFSNSTIRTLYMLGILQSGVAGYVGHYSFSNSRMTHLVIKGRGLCKLHSTTAFDNTPIASGNGYIYVPRENVNYYKNADNWQTYASQFRALEDYTVDGTITGELDESKI